MNRFSKMSLLNRIIGFLLAFGAMILLQITISWYQTTHVLEPLEERTESIQSISQFLNDVEGSMTALENYRWDFGDTDALVETLRQQQKGSDAHLKQIDRELGTVSEEQYLLANAAATTYGTFSLTVEEIIRLLQAGRSDEAADLYYEKAEPCGDYLRQYTQQLLERAIRDNQSTYVNLNRLNGKLKEAQTIVLILIATSSIFGYCLTTLHVPQKASDLLLSITDNPIILRLLINVILLFLGMIMDMAPIILITTPILLPIAMATGMDPVTYGIMLMLNCGIGLLTPPVGSVLFIGASVAKRPIMKVVKGTLPFYLCMIVALLLITFVPDISLLLPKLLGGYVPVVG